MTHRCPCPTRDALFCRRYWDGEGVGGFGLGVRCVRLQGWRWWAVGGHWALCRTVSGHDCVLQVWGWGGVAVCGVLWGRVSGHSGHKGGWGTCLQGPSVSPSRSAGNDIRVDGCKALAEALKSNTSVTSVDVSCMLVYDWGVVGHACVVVDMTGGMRGAGDEVFLRGRSVKQRSVHEEYALVVRFRGGG